MQFFDKSIEIAIKNIGQPKAFQSYTSSSKSPFAKFARKNPTDRAKNGVKRGIVIDSKGIILSVITDSASRHDSQLLTPHIENIKQFFGKPMVLATSSACDVKELRKVFAAYNVALFAATNFR